VIGTVKFYDARRGLGAISPDKGGPDIAVHVSEVERAGLAAIFCGDRFSFDVQTDRARERSFAVNLGPA
jgi:CspA family cold shock protein